MRYEDFDVLYKFTEQGISGVAIRKLIFNRVARKKLAEIIASREISAFDLYQISLEVCLGSYNKIVDETTAHRYREDKKNFHRIAKGVFPDDNKRWRRDLDAAIEREANEQGGE